MTITHKTTNLISALANDVRLDGNEIILSEERSKRANLREAARQKSYVSLVDLSQMMPGEHMAALKRRAGLKLFKQGQARYCV